MKARERNYTLEPRYLDSKDLQAYLSVGKNLAVEIGKQTGARRQIGKLVRYDRKVLDAALDRIADNGADPVKSEAIK